MGKQFLQAIRSAEEGLDLDLEPLSKRIECLCANERLSPGAYVALTTLTEALLSGDITSVSDRLQALAIMPDREFLDATLRVQPILTETWESPFIQSIRQEPIEGIERPARIVRAILGRSPEPEISACENALRLLEEVDPELFEEFREYVTRVKLFLGRGYLGFSSPAAFGAIFIRVPRKDPVAHYLEHLVHELSHLSLNVLMAHDPLLQNPDLMGPAPLREDQRPLYQLLHATYVLGRNLRVTRRMVDRHPELGYHAALQEFEEKFLEGFLTLQSSADFTECGEQLFQSLDALRA